MGPSYRICHSQADRDCGHELGEEEHTKAGAEVLPFSIGALPKLPPKPPPLPPKPPPLPPKEPPPPLPPKIALWLSSSAPVKSWLPLLSTAPPVPPAPPPLPAYMGARTMLPVINVTTKNQLQTSHCLLCVTAWNPTGMLPVLLLQQLIGMD